jgi:hypothetical protein
VLSRCGAPRDPLRRLLIHGDRDAQIEPAHECFDLGAFAELAIATATTFRWPVIRLRKPSARPRRRRVWTDSAYAIGRLRKQECGSWFRRPGGPDRPALCRRQRSGAGRSTWSIKRIVRRVHGVSRGWSFRVRDVGGLAARAGNLEPTEKGGVVARQRRAAWLRAGLRTWR